MNKKPAHTPLKFIGIALVMIMTETLSPRPTLATTPSWVCLKLVEKTAHLRDGKYLHLKKNQFDNVATHTFYHWGLTADLLPEVRDNGFTIETASQLFGLVPGATDVESLYLSTNPKSGASFGSIVIQVEAYAQEYPTRPRATGRMMWGDASQVLQPLAMPDVGYLGDGYDEGGPTSWYRALDPRVLYSLALPQKSWISREWYALIHNLGREGNVKRSGNPAALQWLLTPNYTREEREALLLENPALVKILLSQNLPQVPSTPVEELYEALIWNAVLNTLFSSEEVYANPQTGEWSWKVLQSRFAAMTRPRQMQALKILPDELVRRFRLRPKASR